MASTNIPAPIPAGAGLVNIDPPSQAEQAKTYDNKVIAATAPQQDLAQIGQGLHAHLSANLASAGVGISINGSG